MIKWEYDVVKGECEDTDDYIDLLNRYGDNGWELVVEELSGINEFTWTLKRQRTCFDDPAEVFSDN